MKPIELDNSSTRFASRRLSKAVTLLHRAGRQLDAASRTAPDKYHADLGFTIVQNGDCEGAAIFDPSKAEQARAAISAARIYRKRRVSPSQVTRQITWLRAAAGRAL